jgi:hypothetical protein
VSVFRDAFNTPDPKDPLSKEEQDLLDRLAIQVVKRSMTVPAIIFLESVKPMNYIASQTLVFFEPIIQSVFNFRDYNTLREALEKRQTIEILLRTIEEKDSLLMSRDRAIKKYLKVEKKKWKWYQRWLGVKRPRIDIPEEIKNMPSGLERPEKDEPESPDSSPAQ